MLGTACLAIASFTAPTAVAAAPVATAPAALLPAWDGSIDLYRDGVFTTQKSWLWCTAAGVQIVRNIVERDDDHSREGQRRYFEWMRAKNHYEAARIGRRRSAGLDGGAASLRRRSVSARGQPLVRRGASGRRWANLRRTGLPVALTVVARQPRLEPDRVRGDRRARC